jgi:ADP-ribose pyrophosphatase
MQRLVALPPPPHFDLEIVAVESREQSGFLTRVSRRLRVVALGRKPSASFVYDEVDRVSLDAVVLVAHFGAFDEEGVHQRYVVLRSALRPPVALRPSHRSPVREPANRGLWELPAGLVEPEEVGLAGLRRAGARELLEETGFCVEQRALQELGPSTFPAPGVIAERQFFFHVEVDPEQQRAPSLDGSPLEEAGELVAIPLASALASADGGHLADAKTELGLRRFAQWWEANCE